MALLIVSNHAKKQLFERFGKTSFKKLIPRYSMRIFQDNFDNVKYYFNLSTSDSDGFMVLKKIGRDKFIIKTITDNGKIDNVNGNRKLMKLKFVEVKE